jgi:hypothetical protein
MIDPKVQTSKPLTEWVTTLEIELTTNPKCIQLRGNHLVSNNGSIADGPRFGPGMDVIKNALAVRVDVPIQPGGHIL